MFKDLIIGAISNYTWDQLKIWVNSIQASGFDGDVVMVGTNISKETIDQLSSRGILLELYGQKQDDGSVKMTDSKVPPHVERFFYIWNYLKNKPNKYRFVITTDTRDVFFQKNPSIYLEKNLTIHDMIFSSEGIRYKNEPWGAKNFHSAFGPYYYDQFKDDMIYNVGVIAGTQENMTSLMHLIFNLSLNRPIEICDQAVFNFLIKESPYSKIGYFADNNCGWAIQLGTTKHAVENGAGDIGQIFQKNQMQYNFIYEDIQPIIDNAGQVWTSNNLSEMFVLVHQYDRVKSLGEKIEKLYGDNQNVYGSGTTFYHPV